jgi:hypothetical protein
MPNIPDRMPELSGDAELAQFIDWLRSRAMLIGNAVVYLASLMVLDVPAAKACTIAVAVFLCTLIGYGVRAITGLGIALLGTAIAVWIEWLPRMTRMKYAIWHLLGFTP